jgi:aspartyl protease family protein
MSFQFPHFKLLLALALAAPYAASATEVNVVGLFAGKGAVVVIDGAAPRTLKLGQKTTEGVQLIAVDKETATIEVDGKRKTIQIGQHHVTSAGSREDRTITLAADQRGQFMAMGAVNGHSVHFMVDTGATVVSLPASDAARLGIDYRKGSPVRLETANGPATGWQVKLDAVTIGETGLNNVDAVVIESGLQVALLGMSFLNRFEMRREGGTMTLVRRF